MSSNDNLIVCAGNDGKINDLFKVSPENIVGDTEIKVSPQYENEHFNKMSFVGSGEFTGIYYDDSEDGQSRGNNLGCRGFYVHGWELVSITFTNPEDSDDTVTLSNTDLDNYLYNNCRLYKKYSDVTDDILTELLNYNNICKITDNCKFDGKLTDINEIRPGVQNADTTDQYIRYLCLGTKEVELDDKSTIMVQCLATLSSYPDYKDTKSGTTYKYSSIQLKLYVRDEQISGFESYLANDKPKVNCSSNYTITNNNITYIAANMPSLLKFKIFSDDISLPFKSSEISNELKKQLQDINDNIGTYKNYKYSYTSNNHSTDIFNLIEVDSDNGIITVESNKVLNLLSTFANEPGVLVTTETKKLYSLRTYDTALFTYDDLDFGLCEIFPTCFAVGTNNTAAGDGNIATGMGSKAMGAFSAAFGRSAQARGYTTFATGIRSKALSNGAFACGDTSTASGYASFAAGTSTASGNRASAFGQCQATGDYSHAEGYNSKSIGGNSHAEGFGTQSKGLHSHAEGFDTKAYSNYSHAEGVRNETLPEKYNNNNVSNVGQHAEGIDNKVTGRAAHVGGEKCDLTSGNASPDRSFVHGYHLICNKEDQVVFGKYNANNSNASFIIGGGTVVDNTEYRKNIFEVCADGSLRVPIFTAVPKAGSTNKQLVDTGKRAGIWITTKVEGNRDPKTADDIEIVYNVV